MQRHVAGPPRPGSTTPAITDPVLQMLVRQPAAPVHLACAMLPAAPMLSGGSLLPRGGHNTHGTFCGLCLRMSWVA